MFVINALLLIVGGVLALSGIIVAKRPDAKQYIDKLVPYQAMIGVALLVLGVLNLLVWLGHGLITLLRAIPMYGLSALAVCLASMALGLLFGMPQLQKWNAGKHPAAEQRAAELMAKIAPFQVIIGGIGVVASLLALLYALGIVHGDMFGGMDLGRIQ